MYISENIRIYLLWCAEMKLVKLDGPIIEDELDRLIIDFLASDARTVGERIINMCDLQASISKNEECEDEEIIEDSEYRELVIRC